jgi:hypothetical protein
MTQTALGPGPAECAASPHCDFSDLERRAGTALKEARDMPDAAGAKARYTEAQLLISCAMRAATQLGDLVAQERFTRLLVHAHMEKLKG